MLSHRINISHVVKKHAGFACLLMLGESCPLKTFRFLAVISLTLTGLTQGELSKGGLAFAWLSASVSSKAPKQVP